MPHNEKGQYKADIKLTREEYDQLVVGEDKVHIADFIVGPGYGRPCPGRNGAPCKGDGWQALEIRNMGKPGKPKWEVRDQPCCQKCRP